MQSLVNYVIAPLIGTHTVYFQSVWGSGSGAVQTGKYTQDLCLKQL